MARGIRLVVCIATLVFVAAGPAVAAQADTGLRCSLSMLSEKTWMNASEAILVEFTMTNTGTETVHVLAWQTPLAGIEHDILLVSRDGEPVPYRGRLAKRAEPRPEDYVAIAPGETVSAVFDPSAAYEMTITGGYAMQYRAQLDTVLRAAPAAGTTAKAARAQVESNDLSLWIDGIDPYEAESFDAWTEKKKPGPSPGGSVEYVACTSSEQGTAGTAVANATSIANAALQHLKTNSGGSTLYDTWFGAYAKSRFNKVKSHYTSIAGAFEGQTVTIHCDCDQDYYAYVYPNNPYHIWVCRVFWRASNLGRDSKAGTLVHEMSHFNTVAGTSDYVYGASNAMWLADTDPTKAINNADNHEYFAEDQ